MRRFLPLLILLFLTGCTANGGGEKMDISGETEKIEISAEADRITGSSPAKDPPLLTPLIDPKDSDFVRVTDYVPCLVDLKYATADNFTGQVIYRFQDVFLRYGTVMKLKAAAEELAQQGLGIKIWDGFRPVAAQFKLWEICPDDTYVADPNEGFSNHSRGFAVDLTLVDSEGKELEMPTAFDDFSADTSRDYVNCSEGQKANALLLQQMMEKHGFSGYWGEWWHFNDTTRYEVEECFDPETIGRKYTAVQTPLLYIYEEGTFEVLTIPAGQAVTVLGYDDAYALTEYWGYRGYVSRGDLQ